jgi:hypothetical protein
MDAYWYLTKASAAGEVLTGVHVYVTLPRLVVLVVCLVLMGQCILATARRRTRRAAALGLSAFVLLFAFGATSLLSRPAAWQVLHAAYRDAPPERQRQMVHDIAAKWSILREGMVLGDYYLLTRKWGICHELWPQATCTTVSSEREAMGIARELLTEIARGSSSVRTPVSSTTRLSPLVSNVNLR